MLNFLFDSLREPLLADKAAWAIDQICSTCRKTLTVELEAFLRQYVVILSEHTIDAYVKEKVIGGIAAIIQALPSVESKIGPLSMLVQLTKADIDTCLASIQPEQTPEQVEATVDHATSALRCLHSLGKGLQVPDDVPINLEANYSEEAWFWRNGDGVLLQREVSHLLEETRSILGWHSEIIGALCDILRAGYKEHIPGLFVFKPAVTVHFVQACSLKTPELPYVLDTAQAMLGRQSQEVEAEMKQAAGAFMTFLLSVIDGMGGENLLSKWRLNLHTDNSRRRYLKRSANIFKWDLAGS
ncbi:hypothetical protein MMC21_003411 [Puttea exsequens]|nr:hypothetical protein [Puttea exsequens]